MRVPSSGSVSESTALPEKHEVVSDHFRFKLPDRVCIHHTQGAAAASSQRKPQGSVNHQPEA